MREIIVVAIGCLLLIVLPLVGLVIGALVGSTEVAIGCAIGGFLLAAAICALGGFALVKAGKQP